VVESTPAAAPGPAPAFRPPESELAKTNWLRLNSGEWLRGEIEYMRDGDLEFDSKDLDDLTISFKDIAEFRLNTIEVIQVGNSFIRPYNRTSNPARAGQGSRPWWF
jgi:hypothetical protein